jgi:two-component system, cell cycle response regulator DivK
VTPLRILVVEDNPLNRRLVEALLVHRGHTVLQASTVEEGREQLEGMLPDIVLLDIHIPGGGGELLLAEIRKSTRLAGLPVVAVTASAMSGDRERLLELGFDAYMSKPIDTRAFAMDVEAIATKRTQ